MNFSLSQQICTSLLPACLPSYVYAREHLEDLFQGRTILSARSIGPDVISSPDFFTGIRVLRMNMLLQGHVRTVDQVSGTVSTECKKFEVRA